MGGPLLDMFDTLRRLGLVEGVSYNEFFEFLGRYEQP